MPAAMTARSTLTQIHSKLFALLTGLLLLAAIVVADTPATTNPKVTKTYHNDHCATVTIPTADE